MIYLFHPMEECQIFRYIHEPNFNYHEVMLSFP